MMVVGLVLGLGLGALLLSLLWILDSWSAKIVTLVFVLAVVGVIVYVRGRGGER